MIERIYFQREDGRECDILDALNVAGNCSKLEMSALSSEAKFGAKVEEGMVCLEYYPEFFSVKKKDFLGDIVAAGYKETKPD